MKNSKRIFNTIFLFFLVFSIMGQNYDQCISVIGSMGKSFAFPAISVAFTVGETSIATLSNSAKKATQGFHQPEYCAIGPTSVTSNSFNPEISIYPNPSSEKLFMNLTDEYKNYAIGASIINSLGLELSRFDLQTVQSPIEIDISKLATGYYIMSLEIKELRYLITIPFIVYK